MISTAVVDEEDISGTLMGHGCHPYVTLTNFSRTAVRGRPERLCSWFDRVITKSHQALRRVLTLRPREVRSVGLVVGEESFESRFHAGADTLG